MTVFLGRRRNPVKSASLAVVAAVVLATAGCGSPAPASLVVATSWPLADRTRLEADFQKWQSSARNGRGLGHTPRGLRWLIVAPGDDLGRVRARRDLPDVLLGARAGALSRLAQTEGLIKFDDGDAVPWRVIGRPHAGTAARGDPRTDAATRDWAMRELVPARWREGYAHLVELAGTGRELGGSAGDDLEGVAVLQSARDPAPAREFMRFLLETGQAGPPASGRVDDPVSGPDVESLVADLLGAALVDARDELWTAWDALERAGSPEPARTWLTEPPPWPPASIEKYLRREGENAMALVETLAAELSPLPAARGWLIRSWLSPPRSVDLALLTEMAQAADGALGREPRFRSWLRAEWTASARQRYRRVTRLADRAQPRSVAK